jgi:hypothetical protein
MFEKELKNRMKSVFILSLSYLLPVGTFRIKAKEESLGLYV